MYDTISRARRSTDDPPRSLRGVKSARTCEAISAAAREIFACFLHHYGMSAWGQTDLYVLDSPSPCDLAPRCRWNRGRLLHSSCLVASGGCKAELRPRQVPWTSVLIRNFRMRQANAASASACLLIPVGVATLHARESWCSHELVSSLAVFFFYFCRILLVLVVKCTVVRGERSPNTTLIRSFKQGRSSAIEYSYYSILDTGRIMPDKLRPCMFFYIFFIIYILIFFIVHSCFKNKTNLNCYICLLCDLVKFCCFNGLV